MAEPPQKRRKSPVRTTEEPETKIKTIIIIVRGKDKERKKQYEYKTVKDWTCDDFRNDFYKNVFPTATKRPWKEDTSWRYRVEWSEQLRGFGEKQMIVEQVLQKSPKATEETKFTFWFSVEENKEGSKLFSGNYIDDDGGEGGEVQIKIKFSRKYEYNLDGSVGYSYSYISIILPQYELQDATKTKTIDGFSRTSLFDHFFLRELEGHWEFKLYEEELRRLRVYCIVYLRTFYI